jgi:hypothetical protein
VGAEAALPVREGVVFEDVFLALLELVAPAGEIVVEGRPMPLGPMEMVSPFTTIVVGVADGPMLYVVPEMTTWEAPTLNVTPSTTVVESAPAPWIVVDGNATPLGPILIVCPFTTTVVGVADGPILKVVPDMTTWVDPTLNVTPSTTVVESAPAPCNVVDGNATPLGPILIVCPFTTTVVGVADGPISNVVPPITTCEGPTPTVTPPIAVVEKPGAATVVAANPTPPAPTLIVCPLTTTVVGVAPLPILNVLPEITAWLVPTMITGTPLMTVELGAAPALAAFSPRSGTVVCGPTTLEGPTVKVWPFTTTVRGREEADGIGTTFSPIITSEGATRMGMFCAGEAGVPGWPGWPG